MRDRYMLHKRDGMVFIGQMTDEQLSAAARQVTRNPLQFDMWIMLRLEIEMIIRMNDWKIRQ